jgi:hypothetical protein
MKKRRKFEKRYAEKIGSKVVGVTQDPTEKQDLVDWMNTNMFHIDKTEMKEVDLPPLQREATGVTMDEEVEERYRELTSDIEETMRDMVAFYRDKDEDAYSGDVTGAVVQLAGLFSRLEDLANKPDEVIEGYDKNPKIDEASSLIKNDIGTNSRALLWTDNPEFAKKSAIRLSNKIPGKKHAYGLSGEIGICKNGRVVETYGSRVYEDPETGERVDSGKWRQHVVDTYVKPHRTDIVSFSVTKTYSKGFNMQVFDKVIHLDRDEWNAEKVKQRTARSWRQGQESPVEEYTLDVTYSNKKDDLDRTLDEIGRYIQEMEEELFQEFIKETQKQKPGKVWFGMKKETAEKYNAERDLVELLASPYVENHAEIKEKLRMKEEG